MPAPIGNEVWRDFTTDGIPSSGFHKPKKADIRQWATWVEQIISAFTSSGGLIYASKSALDADLAKPANTMAWVVGDATAANNGIYRKTDGPGSGSWARVADLPYSFIPASDVGDGTPNAIQASSSLPISNSALVLLNVYEANAGSPVTVSFNGGTALTIKSNSGNDIAPGGLTAGMTALGRVSGSTFRLVSDQASASILAGAEAAADRAEEAEVAVLGLLGGVTPVFPTKALASAYSPDVAPGFLQLAGYYAAGDGGAVRYMKVSSEPAHEGKISITLSDGVTVAWYEIAKQTVVDARQFGAVPDDLWDNTGIPPDGTDSTTAIQNAIDYVVANGIGVVYAPGKYRITDTLVLDTGVYTQSISLRGDGSTSRIRQTGAGKDVIWFSETGFMRNSSIKDIELYAMSGAGHVVNIKYGCTVCRFENVNAVALNPAKSCWFGDYSAFTLGEGGVFDTVWSGGDWYQAGGDTTAPGFKFTTNGTTFNENIIENIRANYSGLLPFFYLVNNHPESYLTNNTFRNINFEICKAGGFLFSAATGFMLQNISFWDEDLYVNHLVQFVTGTGYDSTSNVISSMKRHGGALNTGIRDIFLQAANDTTIINLGTQASDNPSYDWSSKRVTVIGGVVSGELNPSQRQRIGALSVLPTFYANAAYIDALHIGGFAATDGAALSYSAGYTQLINQVANSGIKLEARNGSNAARQAFLSPAAFFPLPDNTISLGDATARWTVVYAGTATISTSDENAKQDIEAIPDEWLDAWANVEFCRYRMRDAVEAKGDGARWHVGVIAQRVEASFRNNGIDAFEIGLLCFDEWEEAGAVLDENGAEVVAAKEAGQRYGIRYEEALSLEAAYQRRELARIREALA